MARVRYVNTASSPGGTGETSDTTGASRAYSSLSEWNTNEAADITASNPPDYPGTHTVNLAGTSADTTGNFSISGWTTDASNFITISGDNDTGAYSTSHWRLEYTAGGTYQEGFIINEPYTVMEDLQVQFNNGGFAGCTGILNNSTSASNQELRRCILKGVLTTASADGFKFDGSNINVRACLFYDWDVAGSIGCDSGDGTTNQFQNCTAENCAQGFGTGFNDTDADNCLAQNCTDGFGGTWATNQTNASDISSDVEGQTQTGTVSFTNLAGEDYSLDSGDTVALDNGTDLSGSFDYQLDGSSWGGTWSIGCLGTPASAPSADAVFAIGVSQRNVRHSGRYM